MALPSRGKVQRAGRQMERDGSQALPANLQPMCGLNRRTRPRDWCEGASVMIAVQERRGFAFNNVMPHSGCFHPRNEKRRPAFSPAAWRHRGSIAVHRRRRRHDTGGLVLAARSNDGGLRLPAVRRLHHQTEDWALRSPRRRTMRPDSRRRNRNNGRNSNEVIDMTKPNIAATAAVLLVAGAFASEPAHWEYAGATGPAHWAELSPNYHACADANQSPIDLAGMVDADLPPIRFDYSATGTEVVNNGHTIQVSIWTDARSPCSSSTSMRPAKISSVASRFPWKHTWYTPTATANSQS